jgi:hypothetical protein
MRVLPTLPDRANLLSRHTLAPQLAARFGDGTTDGFSPFRYSRLGLVSFSCAGSEIGRINNIQFPCDGCGKVKKPTGHLDSWRAVEALSITTSSEACKDKYIAEFMDNKQAS